MDRRGFIRLGTGLAVAGVSSWHLPARAATKPVWLSFGLNGPAEGNSRFPLTLAMTQKAAAKGQDFQRVVSQTIETQLRKEGDFVDFSDKVEIHDGIMLGAMLDYENVLSTRLGTASFLVLHLVGHGTVLRFDRDRGWKLIASFPFPVTLLRESNGGNVKTEAAGYLQEAYTDPKNSFATAFARTAKQMASRWSENGSRFNVRVMSSLIHPDVQTKLRDWAIATNINSVWLGHLASAAACEGLAIPVVPFVENQALGKFTYKFSERLTAQNVRLPEEQDIDLRLHVTLRNMVRDVKYRKQLDRWEVSRIVVFDIEALDVDNKQILKLRMGYQDEQPDVVARQDEVVPVRDAHFFDMAIYRGLAGLFSALDRQDMDALAKLFVKPDAEQKKQIENFRRIYRRAV